MEPWSVVAATRRSDDIVIIPPASGSSHFSVGTQLLGGSLLCGNSVYRETARQSLPTRLVSIG